MEGVAETDLFLINSIASDQDALSAILSWIQSHCSNAPSASPPKALQGKLDATTVPSFAVSFLNYIRARTYPFLQSAIAESEQSSIPSVPQANSEQQTRAETRSFGEKQETLEARRNGSNRCIVSNKSVASAPPKVQYEDEFPALGSAPTKDAKKTGKPNARQARRVNPTPMAIPEVDSSFVLAKFQSSKESQFQTSSNLPMPGPLKVDMDVLMDRFNKPMNCQHKDKEKAPGKEDVTEHRPVACSENHLVVDSIIVEAGKSVTSNSKVAGLLPQHAVSNGEAQWSSEDAHLNPSVPLKLFSGELKRLATVHANLLVTKMVPSLIGELYFLLQLLCLEDAILLERQDKLASIEENLGVAGRLFVDCRGCSFYACKALEQTGHLLDCVGEQLLAALIEQPAISRHSPSLLSRLRRVLVDHQSAALRSFKTYESASGTKCALLESPSKSMTERLPNRSPMGMPTSLTFQAARDSRNNFRTLSAQKIYNNRELCRDQFYSIIREAASSQSAFGFVAFGQDNDAYKKLQESVQSFLKLLMTENYPWFSELFVQQYLQASSYGETDPEVTGLARHDATKLQKLHDRLTSESSSQPPAFVQKRGSRGPVTCDTYHVLSPGNTWSKAKCLQSPKILLAQASKHSQENVDFHECSRDGFSKAFPHSARIYILFLEAADSYRLNSQLSCCIRLKMRKLTKLPLYSQDAADIGSGFTQRVLSLKSLGSLMGFLFFYPEVGSLPPVPSDSGHELPDSECDMPPPIDLLEELENARVHESLLLVLPWILDFLWLMKVIPSQVLKPYFEQVFSSLRTLYSLPMLDPSNNNFGVSSMCILAALDSFFEDMGMFEFDGTCLSKPISETNSDHKGRLSTDSTINFCRGGDQNNVICRGIDRVLGIIDTSYIQHCCPILMGMRSILVVANKGRKIQPGCPQSYRGTSVRKITPIQNIRQRQSVPMSNNTLEPTIMKNTVDTDKDQLKLKLQHMFLDQRPHLQRLVDFIVDTVAVNAAHAASLKCVPEFIEDALNKLEIAIMDRLPSLCDLQSFEDFENRLSASNFEAATEHIISTTIQRVLPAAVDYAKKHSADRTVEALSALASPSESPYVLSIAAGIASEAAAIAVSKRTLANISSEIRKQITRAVDHWRRKIQKQIIKEPKEPKVSERVKQEVANHISSVSSADVLTSRCSNIVANLKDKEATLGSSASIPSAENYYANAMGQIILSPVQTEMGAKRQLHFPACRMEGNTGISIDDKSLKDQKIAGFCHQVSDYCLRGTLSNETRNLLRLHLASICLLIESTLTKLYKEVPIGGFDAVVFKPEETESSCILLDEAQFDQLRIEIGLVRRSVALAVYWCLLSPWTAFGFTCESLAECSYTTSQNIYQWASPTTLLDFNIFNSGDISSECQTKTCIPKENALACNNSPEHGPFEYDWKADSRSGAGCHCPYSRLKLGLSTENKDCPVKSLLLMWKSLVKIGLCKTETIILEFMSPWRWQLALSRNPWDCSPSWFGAAAHGISNTMVDMIEIATEKRSALNLLFDSFQEVYKNAIGKAQNSNEGNSQEKLFTSTEARKLLQCITMDLKNNFLENLLVST